MDNIRVQAAIQTLTEQRNAALNAVADLAAEVAFFKAQNDDLQDELDKLQEKRRKKDKVK